MRPRNTAFALAGTAVLLTAFAFSASAQLDKLKSTTPEQRAGMQTDLMKSTLGLTSEQTPKVADINLKYAKRMDPLIKGSADPAAKGRKMEEVDQQKEAELKEVLSPEQFKAFHSAKVQMRQRVEQDIEKAVGRK